MGAYAFPKIPGVAIPHSNRRAFRLDFSVEPPKLGPPFPTLVPQVNADGNETSGIRMPEIQVPLASYTGWNLRSPKIGAPDQLYSMAGSWIPFPVNKSRARESQRPARFHRRALSLQERLSRKDHRRRAAIGRRRLFARSRHSLPARSRREGMGLRYRAATELSLSLSHADACSNHASDPE